MQLGSALQLFALEIGVLQGVVNFLYDALPAFRTVTADDGSYRLELHPPTFETRDDPEYRLGIHLTGSLFLGSTPDAFVFDTWVRLQPAVGADDAGDPVGVLRFDAVEDVVPALAEAAVINAFGPTGTIGAALEELRLDVFAALTKSVHDQLFPGTPFARDAFAVSFYLGRPAALSRPLWSIALRGDRYVPSLEFDVGYATLPALIASVALAGENPVPPGAPSIVRAGTGLGLIVTERLFASRFARESETIVGTELQGLTIDSLDVVSTEYGFDIAGAGHKTGATVTFDGSLVAQFRGGTGGQLLMRSTVDVDVDTAWWVDLLSVIAVVVPVLGWILGEVFIWQPTREAPGKVETALVEKFVEPLADAAAQLANRFEISIIPTEAYLADVWFVDGHMAVAAAAFAGRQMATVTSVTRDIAHVGKSPAGAGRRSNRRRPVESVADINLSTGHNLKPWQAGKLVDSQLLDIPGHHAVHNPLAREGVYLRSNPDDDTSNNLLG